MASSKYNNGDKFYLPLFNLEDGTVSSEEHEIVLIIIDENFVSYQINGKGELKEAELEALYKTTESDALIAAKDNLLSALQNEINGLNGVRAELDAKITSESDKLNSLL